MVWISCAAAAGIFQAHSCYFFLQRQTAWQVSSGFRVKFEHFHAHIFIMRIHENPWKALSITSSQRQSRKIPESLQNVHLRQTLLDTMTCATLVVSRVVMMGGEPRSQQVLPHSLNTQIHLPSIPFLVWFCVNDHFFKTVTWFMRKVAKKRIEVLSVTRESNSDLCGSDEHLLLISSLSSLSCFVPAEDNSMSIASCY